MAPILVVSIVMLACLVLSMTFRAQVINVLRKAGLDEQMGSPRKVFYSDFLHYRVMAVTWKSAIAPHKVLFRSFFVITLILDICCVYAGWWVPFGRA